ncbi:hypothetical protein PQX77_001847, partial [Marasmius sp. AFHP31]
TLLRALPPGVVMPTVFDRVIVRADRDWEATDVESALNGWNHPKPFMAPFTYSRSHIQLIYSHHSWLQWGSPIVNDLPTKPFSRDEHNSLSWVERCGPLTRIVRLMLHGEPLALEYIRNFGCHYADIDTRYFDFVSTAPIISSLAKTDLHLLVGDKQAVVDLLIWFSKEVDYYRLNDPYTLIDALDKFRVSQGLQKDFFARHWGFFRISMGRLNDFLRDSSTAGVAVELMRDFQHTYQADTRHRGAAHLLLEHLVIYLFRNIPCDLEKYSPHLGKELNQCGYFEAFKSSTSNEIPYLLTSQEGLSFLKSLNATIHNHSHDPYAYSPSLMAEWVLGLKCVAHLNNLPLDYFAVRESQPSLGTSGAGPSGETSSSPPDDEEAVDGGNGLIGNRQEEHFNPIRPSTSAEEGARDLIFVGLFESGPAEWNADILERHLFDYLIAT